VRGLVEKKVESEPELEQNLKSVLEVRTAGDPDEQDVLWTDLSPRLIADAVTDMGTPVSPPVVRDWLDDEGLALHKIAKVLEGGQSPDRDAQFMRIAQLKAEFADAGNPAFSMDTKAKEHLGHLFRAGRVYAQRAFKAFDHDYPSWATGVLIPHGIYDIARNRGHINVGLSHDTSEFACDSLRWYWNRIGKQCYPNATSILLLCDGGGSNCGALHFQARPAGTGERHRSQNPGGPLPELLLEVQPDRASPLLPSQPRLQGNAVRHARYGGAPHAEGIDDDRAQDHRPRDPRPI